MEVLDEGALSSFARVLNDFSTSPLEVGAVVVVIVGAAGAVAASWAIVRANVQRSRDVSMEDT